MPRPVQTAFIVERTDVSAKTGLWANTESGVESEVWTDTDSNSTHLCQPGPARLTLHLWEEGKGVQPRGAGALPHLHPVPSRLSDGALHVPVCEGLLWPPLKSNLNASPHPESFLKFCVFISPCLQY